MKNKNEKNIALDLSQIGFKQAFKIRMGFLFADAAATLVGLSTVGIIVVILAFVIKALN